MIRFICLLALQRQFSCARKTTTIKPCLQKFNKFFEYMPKVYSDPTINVNRLFSTSQFKLQNNETALGKIDTKLRLVFTCKKCNTRNDKLVSKLSYKKGIVIVRCDGCDNLHLIADNLGWFQNSQGKNIEEILASKGETVRKFLDPNEETIVDNKILQTTVQTNSK
uniref:DNL-type domain-containing protein n=1 Tax=Clastoptera arizonana TaxID=38151 RepID=A0A1B6BWW1_9HEMI